MKPDVKSGGGLLRANLNEIMESIQGEGLLVGSRNIFLRFSGCNLRCRYCDTPSSLYESPTCRFNPKCGGGGQWIDIENPLTVEGVQGLIQGFTSRWISMTGGEPLLWGGFISSLGANLKPRGYRFLLETNGTLYEELESCLQYLDLISMDYKLPSVTGEDWSREHYEFLQRAKHHPLYIKMVIDSEVKSAEIQQALYVIVEANRDVPLFLQPVSPGGNIGAPSMETLLELQQQCMQVLNDVRILPQLHRYMGIS